MPIYNLLKMLNEKKGCIVSGTSLPAPEFEKAANENRVSFFANGVSFVWLPEDYRATIPPGALMKCLLVSCNQTPACIGACRYKNEN